MDAGRVVVSLDDQSALSGITQTEFAVVSGRLTRLEEPDKAHPKILPLDSSVLWSKYVAHLFENGTGRMVCGVCGMNRDLGDDDGATGPDYS